MSIIEHIILFSILFIVYVFWGKNIAKKSGSAFWKAAIIPILLFVCITGSRYGWGNDFLWYRVQYEFAIYDSTQIAFNWLNHSLTFIGLNYVGAFMVYAFIFITCAFIFLRAYKESSIYMYCFLVPATMYISCHTIRQGIGIAFVFLVCVFFHHRKWLFMTLAALIAYYFHSTTMITMATLIGIFFVLRNPIHYWISIPLYLFFAFVFDVHKVAGIADLLSNFITLDNKFQSYLDSSDKWFGAKAIRDEWIQGTFSLIMSSLFWISLFYLGYRALKIRENRLVLYVYNTVVLGAIVERAVYLFEIFRRLTSPMVMFYFVPLGYIFYVYSQDCKKPENFLLKKYFHVGITFILAYLVMFWGRFIFLNEAADFFWYHSDEYFDINTFMEFIYDLKN